MTVKILCTCHYKSGVVYLLLANSKREKTYYMTKQDYQAAQKDKYND